MAAVGELIQVTAGVIARDGCVLVCQRLPGGHHPGKWEFPGGKLEPGEDLAACMRRELEEELGIDATVGPVLWTTRYQYPERDPIELTFFRIPWYAGTLANRAFAVIKWMPVVDLTTMDFLEGDKEFVAELMSKRVRLE